MDTIEIPGYLTRDMLARALKDSLRREAENKEEIKKLKSQLKISNTRGGNSHASIEINTK